MLARCLHPAHKLGAIVRNDLVRYAKARKRTHLIVTGIIGLAEFSALLLIHDVVFHATMTSTILAWETALIQLAE